MNFTSLLLLLAFYLLKVFYYFALPRFTLIGFFQTRNFLFGFAGFDFLFSVGRNF